jgi:ABC-type branched-subunit amino acid transport system ATPase component
MTVTAERATRDTLTTSGLRKAFGGVPAVDGVDLTVAAGEVVGLIGPNGSGKSTTIGIISGAISPDAGRVYLGDREMTGHRPDQIARHGLVRTFQVPRVWDQLTALENLLVAGTPISDESITGALFRRRSQRHRQRVAASRALETLDYLSISRLADTHAASLSGGQKRLLEFGRLMLTGCKVALLDEPFAGVNPTMIQQLQRVIARLRDDGVAVLLVEHNLGAVAESTDRVAVLALGRVIAEGDLATLRKDPVVIDAYLGAKAALGDKEAAQ